VWELCGGVSRLVALDPYTVLMRDDGLVYQPVYFLVELRRNVVFPVRGCEC
jgi:hypothetical protein